MCDHRTDPIAASSAMSAAIVGRYTVPSTIAGVPEADSTLTVQRSRTLFRGAFASGTYAVLELSARGCGQFVFVFVSGVIVVESLLRHPAMSTPVKLPTPLRNARRETIV